MLFKELLAVNNNFIPIPILNYWLLEHTCEFKDLAEYFGGVGNIPFSTISVFVVNNTCQASELRSCFDDDDSKIPDEILYHFINHPEKRRCPLSEESTTRAEVRRRAKSDLFFLSRYILWETNPEGVGKPISHNLITKESHGLLCDFFVKKNDSLTIAEQDTRKDRLLLWPRGGFKSSLDVCDVVQWILNFPDIRILFLTAADDLAIGFVSATRSHFLVRLQDPSLMNIYFPEYCVTSKELGNAFEFTCPLWSAKKIDRIEPTVTASSIVSTLSGFHYEVIKADDTVSNKNSENEDQCTRVINNFAINRKMLRPFGYCDMIGTRYHDTDMYGTILEKNVGEIKKESFGPCIEVIDNLTSGLRAIIGRAIVIKPEVAERLQREGKKIVYTEAKEEGCDILLPNILSYQYLMIEFNKDEISFEGQYNQNPTPSSVTVFDRPLLVANTVSFQEMPFRGPVSQTWDFAFSDKKKRDYTTGSSVIWNDKGQFFVHDLIRARYKPYDLAKAVVDFAVKWRPYVIGIEEAGGSKMLEPTIKSEALKTGDAYIINLCSHIDWYTPDLQKDAKRMRMASLHPWLVDGNMKFANFLPILEIIYAEFERCLTSHRHDDIPDVLSQQIRYAPRMAQLIDSKDLQTYSQLDAAWNMLFEEGCDAFGRPGFGVVYPRLEEVQQEEEIKAESPEGYSDNILGSGIFG